LLLLLGVLHDGRKGIGSTAKFTMTVDVMRKGGGRRGDGDDDIGFSELGAMDGAGSDLLEKLVWWRQLIGGGCRGQKIEEKPIRLQQRSWDAEPK
jgi:hypothetical protein